MSDSSSPVTRLMAEALSGRLSRRDVGRRAAALGLSAPMVGMLMNATAGRAGAQDASPAAGGGAGSAIVVPEGLSTEFEGTSIAAVLADSSDPNGPFIQAACEKFTEATGIEVQFVPGETQTDQRLQAYRQQWAGQSSDFDVYQIDVIWPGIVAEHAIDLNPALGEFSQQFFPAIIENNTVDGALVGMPWFTDAGLLYYRTDLLEKYGLEAPTTWEELTQAAQAIQDGEQAENNAFVGFVWQGRAYEGLTCNGLEWQVSNGGGTIIDGDGNITVNNPEAIAAFELARSWVGTISPQDVTTFREPETFNVWSAGNAAFARNWPYMYAASQEAPAIAGKVGVSPLPAGSGADARNAATLGGWQLMVSRYSANPDAATEFVRYMTSPEVQLAFAIERSMLPTIPSVYEAPELAEVNEFIPQLLPVFQSAVARPSSVTGDLYPEISAVYYTELNQVLSGAKGAAEAVESMVSEMESILGGL